MTSAQVRRRRAARLAPSVATRRNAVELPEVDGVSHRWVRARGLDFHVAEAGEGDDVVLCLHGWPQHWYEWRHLMPALADAATGCWRWTCAASAGPTRRRAATRRRTWPTTCSPSSTSSGSSG